MEQNDNELEKSDRNFKVKAALFYAGLSGFSILGGFAGTLILTRREDPKFFNKGMVGAVGMSETGAGLAMRALAWGSLYAIAGCSVICFGIWKISGAQNFREFREKIGSSLPRLTPTEQKTRTDFASIRELMTYLSNNGKE